MEIQDQLVIVDPKDFGIEETKAKELTSNLPQIIEERKVLEVQYSEIIKMDIDNPETSKKASELRKLIKENRTKGIVKWHEVAKNYFLKGGQFVDAIKRKEIAVNERMEETLEGIEKHQETKEAERKKKLSDERLTELNKYDFQLSAGIDLGSLDEPMYQNFLSGCKATFEAKKAEEQKAEEQRLENLRLDKIENERRIEIAPFAQFIPNHGDIRNMSSESFAELLESLKKDKLDYDKEQEKIRLENARLKEEKEALEAKAKADQEALEAKATAEREEADRKLKEANEKAEAERVEAQRIAKIESEKQAKIIADQQAEIQAKKDKETKELADKLALEELELSKGDAAKFDDLIKDLEQLKTKYAFKSKKYKDSYKDCITLLDKTINHLISKK